MSLQVLHSLHALWNILRLWLQCKASFTHQTTNSLKCTTFVWEVPTVHGIKLQLFWTKAFPPLFLTMSNVLRVEPQSRVHILLDTFNIGNLAPARILFILPHQTVCHLSTFIFTFILWQSLDNLLFNCRLLVFF